MSTLKRKVSIVSAALCLVALAFSPLVLTCQYARVGSPDGRFYAVATFPIWRRCVPVMPGQSGDKAGHITIYTAAGLPCGSIAVEMVSFIRDLEWGEDRASIRLVAEWDLAHRRVRRLQ